MLYIGVTADLAARMTQHRDSSGSTFCGRYNLTRVVLTERHTTIKEATAPEKALKAWKREWKIRLVEDANPYRIDLGDDVVAISRDPSLRWDDGESSYPPR